MTTHHISQQRKEPSKCFQRRKYGHLKRYCCDFRESEKINETPFKRNYHTRKNSCNITNSKGNSSNTDKDGHIGPVTSSILFTSKKETKLIIDSEATCHMCNDAEKCMDFESFDVAQEITLGDGHSVEALEKGTIEMSLKLPNKNQRECYLYETLCVPKLSFDLLSVCKGSEHGKKLFLLTRVVKYLMKKEKLSLLLPNLEIYIIWTLRKNKCLPIKLQYVQIMILENRFDTEDMVLAKGQIVDFPVTLRRKENTGMRTRILMSFNSFNDSQKYSPCVVSSYMEENSCKW